MNVANVPKGPVFPAKWDILHIIAMTMAII
jgi:hypothetical protein